MAILTKLAQILPASPVTTAHNHSTMVNTYNKQTHTAETLVLFSVLADMLIMESNVPHPKYMYPCSTVY